MKTVVIIDNDRLVIVNTRDLMPFRLMAIVIEEQLAHTGGVAIRGNRFVIDKGEVLKKFSKKSPLKATPPVCYFSF